MEFSKSDMNILKGIAILFMLILHLFCTKDVNGLFVTFPTIDGVPLVYYLALFGDACVPIYCFASGYGLFMIFKLGKLNVNSNLFRVLKLLVNFWIVLIMFVGIGFLAGKGELFPGSSTKFLQNFFVLSSSYNGAWWFLQTYIILVLLSPLIMRLVSKFQSIILLLLVGGIYLISYIQRINHVLDLSAYPIFHDIVQSTVLVGTSLLPFIAGSVFAKEKVYSKMYQLFSKLKFKNTICAVGIVGLVFIHSLYQSMIIAPITAIIFVCLFSLIDKSTLVQKLFNYFSIHSTNIWLTHMFFYLTIYPSLVFYPKYPILIFIWLVVLCLVSSHCINLIYFPLVKLLDNKITAFKSNNKVISMAVVTDKVEV